MKFKYPKFTLLFLIYIITYIFFSSNYSEPLKEFIISSGYFGAVISGMMYTFAFTSGPATAAFLILGKSADIIVLGLISGIGSVIGDLFIFFLARSILIGEVKLLSKEKFMGLLRKNAPVLFNKWFLIILGCIIAASPLSDEVGVFIIASATNISAKKFAPIGYVLNTLGIITILFIGNAVF